MKPNGGGSRPTESPSQARPHRAPDRTSVEAIAAAKHAVWKPRLDGLQRASWVASAANERRDAIWKRFDQIRGSLGGPPPVPESAPEEIREAVTQVWNATSPEIQKIARDLHEANEWEYREMRAIENERDEQERSPLLPFGDAALAKLAELKSDLARLFTGGRPPTPDTYKDVFLRLWVPRYNAISTSDRYCVECGTLFARRDGHEKLAIFCSDSCSAAARVRAQRARKQRPTKKQKAEAALQQHWAACGQQGCATCDDLFRALVPGSSRTVESRARRLRDDE